MHVRKSIVVARSGTIPHKNSNQTAYVGVNWCRRICSFPGVFHCTCRCFIFLYLATHRCQQWQVSQQAIWESPWTMPRWQKAMPNLTAFPCDAKTAIAQTTFAGCVASKAGTSIMRADVQRGHHWNCSEARDVLFMSVLHSLMNKTNKITKASPTRSTQTNWFQQTFQCTLKVWGSVKHWHCNVDWQSPENESPGSL